MLYHRLVGSCLLIVLVLARVSVFRWGGRVGAWEDGGEGFGWRCRGCPAAQQCRGGGGSDDSSSASQ
jgi:hypothetical protein